MNTRSFFSLIACALLAVTGVQAQSFYTETGEVTFHSKVPLHTFSGSSGNLTGLINLEDKTVDFYVDLETLDTGNGKRDKDMRLTLDTEKHPFAEFFGTLISDFDPGLNEAQEVEVEGEFKIHGQKQKIVVKGTLTPEDGHLTLKAGWTLLLEDYDIEPPKLLFIKVDQEQDIEIEAKLAIQQ